MIAGPPKNECLRMKTGYGTASAAGKRPTSAKGRQMWGTNAGNRALHSGPKLKLKLSFRIQSQNFCERSAGGARLHG
jgi:hypothetical protein